MPLSLGPNHMSNIRHYEVQRTNNFEVVLDGFDDDFTLSIETCPLPVINNDPIELAYGNARVKVAGQATFDDVSLQVKDFIDVDLENVMWGWRCQVYDPSTDAIGWAEDYKRNGYIHLFAPDGTCDRAWRIQGVWPTSFDSGELNYDGGDKKLITMNLAVDKAFLER